MGPNLRTTYSYSTNQKEGKTALYCWFVTQCCRLAGVEQANVYVGFSEF